jgi:hypothetical protein
LNCAISRHGGSCYLEVKNKVLVIGRSTCRSCVPPKCGQAATERRLFRLGIHRASRDMKQRASRPRHAKNETPVVSLAIREDHQDALPCTCSAFAFLAPQSRWPESVNWLPRGLRAAPAVLRNGLAPDHAGPARARGVRVGNRVPGRSNGAESALRCRPVSRVARSRSDPMRRKGGDGPAKFDGANFSPSPDSNASWHASPVHQT